MDLWMWRKLSSEELNCGVGEDSWESLGLQGEPTCPSSKISVLNINWKNWCWSWNSSTLATWCKSWFIRKDPDAGKDWRWEEKETTEWDGWMASPIWWIWVWASSGSWWWTGKPGVLQSMGCKELDLIEWLSWTDLRQSLEAPGVHLCYSLFLLLLQSYIQL